MRAVFDSVAPRYDVMNDVMSLGVHRLWKRDFVASLEPQPGHTLLDLAAGTGDIGLAWLRAGGGPVVLLDVNASMLGVARGRARDQAASLVIADAEALPIADRSVDRVSMAFGLRNCTHKDRVLAEARRVLRPGGRFLCLEFSRVRVAALAPLYDAWSFGVLPRLGQAIAGDADSYQYLAESIRTFPDQERLASMMREGWTRTGAGAKSYWRDRGDPLGLALVTTLAGRSVLLIISGGIAAYKALELVRLLTADGACVRAVLTAGGAQFVTALSLQTLTGEAVFIGSVFAD